MSYEPQRTHDAYDYNDNDDGSTDHLAFVESSGYLGERMRQRKRIRCAILALPLLIVGLIVAAALTAFQKGSTSPATGSTYSHQQITIPSPPSDLATKCSIDNVQTTAGKRECRMICEPAECCDFPSNLALSCLVGNEDKCHVYHSHCHVQVKGVVDMTKDIPPPAPKDLGSVCSSTAIATIDGFTQCQSHCARASCCFDKSVAVCQLDVCTGYAPCLVLGATNYVHSKIPIEIDNVCAGEQLLSLEGRTQCKAACSHALCCFTTEGCSHHDNNDESLYCDQYEKCNELEQNLYAIASAKEIKSECMKSVTEYTHMSLCEVECERGACCFRSEGCDDLFPDVDCSIYEPCKFLFDSGTGSDTTTTKTKKDNNDDANANNGIILRSDVDDVCIGYDPAGKNTDTMPCAKICKGAKCCFDSSVDCATDGLICSVYSACKVIYHGDTDDLTFPQTTGTTKGNKDESTSAITSGGPDADADAIKAACYDPNGDLSTDTASLALCEETCRPGECCFSHGGCTDSNTNCRVYSPCTFFFSDGNGPTAGHTVASTLKPSDFTKADIIAACKDIGSVSSMCKNICKAGACCFDASMECPVGSICENYANCPSARRLQEDDGNNNLNFVADDLPPIRILGGKDLKDILTEVCMEGKNDDDHLETCQTLCQKGKCCFANNKCEAPEDVQCVDYLPCFVLYGPTEDDDTIVELKEEATSDFAHASEVADEEMKTGHAPIVHENLTYEMVQTACTDHESLHLPGMPSMCVQYCSQGICCFDEEQDCGDDVNCSIYVPCASPSTSFASVIANIKSPSSFTSISPAEPITTVPKPVDEDAIEKMKVDEACDGSDMSHCVRKCVEAACCYALTETESCKNTHPYLNCDVYTSCDGVYGREADDGEQDSGRL